MARTKWHVCTTCATIHLGTGKCDECAAKAQAKSRAQSDRQRRPDGNPYNTRGHKAFRAAVLAREPICVDCRLAVSTDADHDPYERAELIAMGLDPNDPQYGHGRCHPCHSKRTAATHEPRRWQ